MMDSNNIESNQRLKSMSVEQRVKPREALLAAI
jgi:hypothetical protein